MTSIRDGAFIDDETRLSGGPRRGHVRDVKRQLSGTYLPVHVGGHLSVVLRGERARQIYLNRLRGRKGIIHAGTLACQRLVALVDLIWNEDGLGLAVRAERDRLGGRVPSGDPELPTGGGNLCLAGLAPGGHDRYPP